MVYDKAKPFKDGLMLSLLLNTTNRATVKVMHADMESREKESQRVAQWNITW